MQEAIGHLRQALANGQEWISALLEAMGLWPLAEETVGRHRWRYLVAGEALDWPLLARRLCADTDGLVPVEEKETVFLGFFPRPVSEGELRRALGMEKFRAYLNFWYGVQVEQALQEVEEARVRKEHLSRGRVPGAWLREEAFTRLYGEPYSVLRARFCQERGWSPSHPFTRTEANEFTYSLFRLRLSISVPERVASDTRRGLEHLARLQSAYFRRWV
ncbi:hypothetical protein HRbin23_01230 [bacterium HR23]|nr:hypothetical protein HRbin23_01230 [bacterium HR23]